MLKVSKILSVLSSPYIQANITSGTIFLNIKILSSLSLSLNLLSKPDMEALSQNVDWFALIYCTFYKSQ
ncbi:hypothetical protein RO3G_06526 [Rhizopus delemar RA 99-880]|uniref:Uncharacterized protein n=1 Tax=Rhizopus delemar (strain RA 99-880 / ATCC MYA-4621 / FGSC 9543 / NRRL 43880) TaxID=246409 RepID=I1C041_RHIO9|nr:hypothetical protein RO3G_06526 [Rhizopus delemar RA 99-880]|eukprot:EIE81821.1 hypothetical protein RO3G_06526 [Rhizopus delemar RA 99-880]